MKNKLLILILVVPTLIGIVVFVCSLFIYVFISLTNHQLIVSLELAKDLNSWLKPSLIIFGISWILFGISSDISSPNPRSRKKGLQLNNFFSPFCLYYQHYLLFGLAK